MSIDSQPQLAGCFERPTNLLRALDLMDEGYLPLAGGTDYYPARVGRPITDNLLDITALAGLGGVFLTEAGSGFGSGAKIGALATWRDCCRAELPESLLALAQAAREVGGWQVQNRGTVGGNLCNASPAADGTVALLALGGIVELICKKSVSGQVQSRYLKVDEFVLGNRLTALSQGELLTSVTLPARSNRAKSAFVKLGHRRYLVISIVMVAVQLDFDEAGQVTLAAIAVGSCTKAAVRLYALESELIGVHRDALIATARSTLLDSLCILTPLDDIRGTAHYRQVAAAQLVIKALEQCL